MDFRTTFDRYAFPLEDYIGEAYIFPNKVNEAVKVSLGYKPRPEYQIMYYYGDRDKIPDRLKETFGYK